MAIERRSHYFYDTNTNEILPRRVTLEACSLCQLNCPGCFMRMENNCDIGQGYLKFDDFVKFVELNPYIERIDLSACGEIFLNPELGDIIKYAFYKDIQVSAITGVNFNTVTDEILESIVKYKFYGLLISIDGWSQESYVQYRRNGNFEMVIENIKKLNALKKKYSSDLPCLTWKYIIFEHNDNIQGLKTAQLMAKELDMNFVLSQDAGGYIPKEIIKKPEYDDFPPFLKWYLPCLQLWREPHINYDGRLYGCCMNHYYFFGGNNNAFNVPLRDLLKDKEMVRTKQLVMGEISGNINPVCENRCQFYQKMKSSGSFISGQELFGVKVRQFISGVALEYIE